MRISKKEKLRMKPARECMRLKRKKLKYKV